MSVFMKSTTDYADAFNVQRIGPDVVITFLCRGGDLLVIRMSPPNAELLALGCESARLARPGFATDGLPPT